MASRLPVKDWRGYIGEPSIADAVLDRVVHNAYKLSLKGASRRKEKAKTVD
ncbi:unnamed protein product [marine sediment metagenome]|uniref:IstB-like ATP-binding domain-containing protein n=1 Tax=marine sediment metagenome TaxID=412755 RepID=X0XPF6_9ZZZZ